jgi:hypothetical protein
MKEFNPTGEFEFQESTREFEETTGEFEYPGNEFTDKSEVIIFTNNYRIHGKIALVPGARLTDYIVDAKSFIAVVDVEVKDKAGNLILKTPFLDVHRDHIEIILPAELATLNS